MPTEIQASVTPCILSSVGILLRPIATRARLTLYYQAEKICGRHLFIINFIRPVPRLNLRRFFSK